MAGSTDPAAFSSAAFEAFHPFGRQHSGYAPIADDSATARPYSGNGAVLVSGQQLTDMLQKLLDALGRVPVRENCEDSFSWALTTNGVFSVKSCYDFFMASLSGPPLDSKKILALIYLWKYKVPSKTLDFGWRFIHNRIATRDQLVRMGVLVEGMDSLCSLCMEKEESLSHLFLSCEITTRIWRRVFMCLDLSDLLTLEDFGDFFYNYEKIPCLNKRMIVANVWLATVWSIWSKRNAVIFKEEPFSFTECMSEIIFNSWRWISSFHN
ncbi:uncharacterized protein LOC131658516 [Vicia villosa]|uniref:uncharacterized protein LOC131658516 n=1 Tax=Vicia villosa TaxID=3911 RepID=UPI00273BE244|nr:uncharacterized protein LOC131658516 [Vicia villosa]